MNNLKEFQKEMPKGFDSIAVDITGFCNAKCKYCPAGDDLTNKGKFISLELFEQIIQKLVEYKMYSSETNFHIYGLGEPCLHPQINEILRILKKYNIHTAISTNVSVVPKFEADALECVDRFILSMPGFSQESYDKIHGFNFDKIKKNIIELRNMVEVLSTGRIPFEMSYHIYQFNEAEMVPAKRFCDENNIKFAPNYAVMFDKTRCLSYVNNTMSFEELKNISKDIFLGVLDQQIKDAPRDYCDFQHSFIAINADGNVRLCSSYTWEIEQKLLLGNIVTDDIDEIIWRKYHHPKCIECIKAGLTLKKGYECKVYPNGFYSIMKENEFVLSSVSDARLKEKVLLLQMIRDYEYNDYQHRMEIELKKYIMDKGFSKDEVKELCNKYTRFRSKTYGKVEQLF